MSYRVYAPSGRHMLDHGALLVALDVMHALGKGARVTNDTGVLLATNAGRFNMFVGRDEAVHQRLQPWLAVSCMPAGAWS